MAHQFIAGCLLLVIVSIPGPSHAEYFQANSDVYCPLPKDVEHRTNQSYGDFKATCEHQRQEDESKLAQMRNAIKGQLDKQVELVQPVQSALREYIDAIPANYHQVNLANELQTIEELRVNVLITAIEAGRITDALTQYVLLQPWDKWRTIADALYSNPRRHPKHIENMLAFIRALPVREERVNFYLNLKGHMVKHNDYMSYLGAIFAYDAHSVVYADDGKTALNKANERALVLTMVDGAAGHFRRAFLTGAKRYELFLLDRDYPELFDRLYPTVFKIYSKDMRKFNSWKMMEGLCEMHRPLTKARLFLEAGGLLQKHFKWDKQNEFYAPMLAGYLHRCLPRFQKDRDAAKLVDKLMEMFKKFHQKHTYETLRDIVGNRIYTLSG